MSAILQQLQAAMLTPDGAAGPDEVCVAMRIKKGLIAARPHRKERNIQGLDLGECLLARKSGDIAVFFKRRTDHAEDLRARFPSTTRRVVKKIEGVLDELKAFRV